jgi:osmotically-inducible protein OsmY
MSLGDNQGLVRKRRVQMKNVVKVTITVVALAFMLVLASALTSAQDPSAAPAPDNSKVNERDRNKTEPTADQQKENRSDQDITQQIRQSIIKDESLSSYAHNVKIISQNGMVTLKGPVRSEDEKSAIVAKAVEVVGQDKVTNQLEVKPKQ